MTNAGIDWLNLALQLGSIVLTLVIGIWTVRDSIFTRLREITQKIDDLKAQASSQGTLLTKSQAEQLLLYYLSNLRVDLTTQVRVFCEQVLPTVVGTDDKHVAKNFVYVATTNRIDQHRANLATFLLAPDLSLQRFLNKVSPVNDPNSIIHVAQQKVMAVFDSAIAQRTTKAAALSQAEAMINEASDQTQKTVLDALNAFH